VSTGLVPVLMEAKPLPPQDRFDELRRAVLNGER
jgi:hypothetical protein